MSVCWPDALWWDSPAGTMPPTPVGPRRACHPADTRTRGQGRLRPSQGTSFPKVAGRKCHLGVKSDTDTSPILKGPRLPPVEKGEGEGGSASPEGAGLTAALGSGPHCLGRPPGPPPGPPTCHGPPSALRAARCSPAPPGLPGHPADSERTAPQVGAGGPGRDFEAFLPCSQGGPRLSLPPTPHRVRLQGAQPLPPAHSCLLARGFLSRCHPGWVICPPRSPICAAHTHTQAPAPTCGPFPEPHARPCAQGRHGSSATVGAGVKGAFPQGPP